MSLADLAGQHVMVDIAGAEVTPAVERLVRDGRIGGVILFEKNIRSAAQVRGLAADLQALASSAGLPPLVISVDQEGGVINRLTEGVTVFPGPMGIAAGGRADDAAAAARMTALELRALGINVNHAPVLDVNMDAANPIIGVRAFADEAREVARFGAAYVAAAREGGILATPKHFPGHGATAVDSHLALPRVAKDRARLREEDLEPFAAAFGAGADGLLAAHVVYPAHDPERPASLSHAVLTALLREALGFSGVVFTDSMEMEAISAHWERGAAAVAALGAGADIVMACGTPAAQWRTIESVRAAARDGSLAAGALTRSAGHIAEVKARYATLGSPPAFAKDIHEAAARAIAERAVTLVRRAPGRIPLPEGRTVVLHAGSESWVTAPPRLAEALAALLPGVTVASRPADVTGRKWDAVIAVSLSWRSDAAVGTLAALHREFGERLIVVGAGNPYELLRVPNVPTYLAAYGPDPASMRAAAGVLAGQLEPTGRLPVALPPLYPRGHSA